MLMSSDVSGIPSFCLLLFLCVTSLWEHTPCIGTAWHTGRTEQSEEQKCRFQRAVWRQEAADKGDESGRRQAPGEPEDFRSRAQD